MARSVDGMKRCAACHETKPVSEFPRDRSASEGLHHRCKVCARETQRRLRSVTPEMYATQLARQGGVCAICKGPPSGRGKYHIDHDHTTGRLRGLLCVKCNAFIGMADESGSRFYQAMVYLDRFDDRPLRMPWEHTGVVV